MVDFKIEIPHFVELQKKTIVIKSRKIYIFNQYEVNTVSSLSELKIASGEMTISL
jgi:hypothetical protein